MSKNIEEIAEDVINKTLSVAKHKVSVTDNQFLIWMKENIAESLSAERNANLEKINELEERRKGLCINLGDSEGRNLEKHTKIKSLESKLAEAEKRYEKMSQNFADANAEIVLLEAEAKAVRSKTIEETATIAGKHECGEECFYGQECQEVIYQAIRALNNEKE